MSLAAVVYTNNVPVPKQALLACCLQPRVSQEYHTDNEWLQSESLQESSVFVVQAPAANHKGDQRALFETFSMSNMSPQVGKGFNRSGNTCACTKVPSLLHQLML